jgi:hypothetical protein
VNVITSQFVDAASAQSEALGFSPALVVVPHPVQNRTTAELHSLADDAFDSILGAIVRAA